MLASHSCLLVLCLLLLWKISSNNSSWSVEALRLSPKCAPLIGGTAHCSDIEPPFGEGWPAFIPEKDPGCYSIQGYPIYKPRKAVHVKFRIKGDCIVQMKPNLLRIAAVDEASRQIGRWELNKDMFHGLTRYDCSRYEDKFVLDDTTNMVLGVVQKDSLSVFVKDSPGAPASSLEIKLPQRDVHGLVTNRMNGRPDGFCAVWVYEKPEDTLVQFIAEMEQRSVEQIHLVSKTRAAPYIIKYQSQFYKFYGTPRPGGGGDPANPANCHSEDLHKEITSHLVKVSAPPTLPPPTTTTTTTTITTTTTTTPLPLVPTPPIIIIEKAVSAPPLPTPRSQVKEVEMREEIATQYNECGTNKQCLTPPPQTVRGAGKPIVISKKKTECVKRRDCSFFVSYGKQETNGSALNPNRLEEHEILIEMSGKSIFWIALGFSHDRCMGDDFVVECVNGNSRVLAFASFNLVMEKRNRRARGEDFTTGKLPIRLLHGFTMEGNIYCTFAIQKSFTLAYTAAGATGKGKTAAAAAEPPYQQGKHFDFERQAFYSLMATGFSPGNFVQENGNLNKHGRTFVSLQKSVFATKFGPSPHQQELIFWHGYLMFFLWIVLVPFSILLAKYYKETFTEWDVWGRSASCLVHILTSILGLILLFLAHFLLSEANSDWSFIVELPASKKLHLWFGLGAAGLYFFNCVNGCVIRETARGESPFLPNRVHIILGHLTYATSCALHQSPYILYSYLPCSVSQVVIGWMVTFYASMVVISYHSFWVDYMYKLVFARLRRLDENHVEEVVRGSGRVDAPGSTLRKWLLLIFILIALIFCTSFIYMIRNAERRASCYSLKDYDIESIEETEVVVPKENVC